MLSEAGVKGVPVGHTSFLRRFAFAILLALWGSWLGAQDTTVVLLRHAERISTTDGASLLSEAGHARARNLVPQLEAFHPSALYASDLERTQQTLAPLAAKLGVPVRVHSRRDSAGLAADILRTQRGRTTVVCWHHDLAPDFVKALGVPEPLPELSFEDYGWLWIVRVSAKGAATLEERRQSAPAAAAVPQGR
jgi:2,3-bisphosphoglycerate-dependent phosphoglycerate mutase